MDEILTRRKALVGTGGLIAAGGAGVMLTGSAAAAETGLTIEGTSVVTHDGQVDDVKIDVSIHGEYSGCSEIDTLTHRLQTVRNGEVEDIRSHASKVVPDPNAGQRTEVWENVSLTERTSWEPWMFDATEDGSEKTTTVPLRVFFAASTGSNAEVTATASTEATVTVANVEATGSVEGSGSLDAEADSEVEN